MLAHRIAYAVLRPLARFTRGHTLGAQGIVIDEGPRVLLVRHGYRPGWHFPGGGVEWGETMRAALARELEEETGVVIEGEPELHGLFANFNRYPNDHVAVYIVRAWRRPRIPAPNGEIVAQDFFALDALPPDTAQGARNRLAEIFSGRPLSERW